MGDDGAPRWRIFDTADAVAEAAGRYVLAAAAAAIARDGAFRLVLAGGSTPEACYRWLAGQDADWRRWHLWFGDERCLPADHPDRNSRMAARGFGGAPIPPGQIHRIPAEAGAAAAAARYAAALPDADFDLVLLGLGEDGHTASLFPGGAADGAADVLAVAGAPKPPAERVTLSAGRLSRSAAVLFLVSGAAKRDAVAAWRSGRPLPAGRVHGRRETLVFADRAAMDGREEH